MASPATVNPVDGTSPESLRNHLGTSGAVGGSRSPHHEVVGTGPTGDGNRLPLPAITLPWKVLVADNARHGVIRGRILLTSRYREALAAASILAMTQWRQPALKTPVRLVITLYEPDRRRRDIGNYTKLIADALTRVAFVDDSQIDRLELVRGPLCRENARADIQVMGL